jgi:hypothetical protein
MSVAPMFTSLSPSACDGDGDGKYNDDDDGCVHQLEPLHLKKRVTLMVSESSGYGVRE